MSILIINKEVNRLGFFTDKLQHAWNLFTNKDPTD